MPVEMKIFNINVPFGIKMLTKLKLVFRHLRDHKFRQGFRVTLNPFCSCSIEAETTKPCASTSIIQTTLMNDVENIPIFFLAVNDEFNDTKIEKY